MGQKQAAYDATGAIIAFYDKSDSPAPAGIPLIDITEAEWQQCLSTPGYRVIDNLLVAPVPPSAAQLLAEAKTVKTAELTAACRSEILNGFASTALGTSHHYPSKDTDQHNLTTAVLDSLLHQDDPDWTTPFWCADSASEWSFRPHTAAQIQQVGKAAKAATLAAMAMKQELTAQVESAAILEAVNAIAWN
jgi:hypothetical protein